MLLEYPPGINYFLDFLFLMNLSCGYNFLRQLNGRDSCLFWRQQSDLTAQSRVNPKFYASCPLPTDLRDKVIYAFVLPLLTGPQYVHSSGLEFLLETRPRGQKHQTIGILTCFYLNQFLVQLILSKSQVSCGTSQKLTPIWPQCTNSHCFFTSKLQSCLFLIVRSIKKIDH